MNLTAKLIKPPVEEYGDEILYGQRMEAVKAAAQSSTGRYSDCVIIPLGTAYMHKQFWTLKNLVGNDSRLKSMMEIQQFKHALALQRYCWPQLERAEFPFLAISPESTVTRTNGLLFTSETTTSYETTKTGFKNSISSRIIDQDNFDFDSLGAIPESKSRTAHTNGTNIIDSNEATTSSVTTKEHFEVCEELITHPKYIVICSSHQQVEQLDIEIKYLKMNAFGKHREVIFRLAKLPPKTRTIDVHMGDEIMALNCNEAEILITTPGALLKCIQLQYITFKQCNKVFFDDIDLALHLHNHSIKAIIKHYLIIRSEDESSINRSSYKQCMIYMFARKWTELVKTYINSTFKQILLMFGSVAEAALYSNMSFDLELYRGITGRLKKLKNIAKLYANQEPSSEKVAIVCRSSEEAETVSNDLRSLGLNVKFLPEETAILSLKSKSNGSKPTGKMFYTMTDSALDLIVEDLNNISCIIHYPMPQEMLTFDRRFRLMHSHIEQKRKTSTRTTLFIGPRFNPKQAQELYDMMSRSNTTLQSTKLALRDFIKDINNTICWRWASTGACRLDKFSRGDRFGTFCSDKHSLSRTNDDQRNSNNQWPKGGQLKITITHLVSPNEFYFWFEEHRDKNSIEGAWAKLESTGSEFMKGLQKELDALKDTRPYSISWDRFKRDKVYGVYLHHEGRVDRVKLVDDIIIEKELADLTRSGYQASKQCQVIKIDYGSRINVNLKNLFELPWALEKIERQCHRGFHIGVKPTDNEPSWLPKARQKFCDLVCLTNLREIRVWLRLNSHDCFWFEGMEVIEGMRDYSDRYISLPHQQLIQAELADPSKTEPSCLEPSDRLLTISKWDVEQTSSSVQSAFLRRDKEMLDIFLLHTLSNLDLKVRQIDYNKQLIDLEDDMMKDFEAQKLNSLNYFDVDVHCLAKLPDGTDATTKEPKFTINRCKIMKIADKCHNSTEVTENAYTVECLDHGDEYDVDKSNLYLATSDYFARLPSQAISCQLADLNNELLNDSTLCRRIRDIIYDYSRTDDEQLVYLKCKPKNGNKIQLFVWTDGDYCSLESVLETNHQISLVNTTSS